MNRLFLKLYEAGYRRTQFPPLFTKANLDDSERSLIERALRYLDAHPSFAEMVSRLAFDPQPVAVGGVSLPHPAILGAGVVKGRGYFDKQTAFKSLYSDPDAFVPGAYTLSDMVGAVEFGSFTATPHIGDRDNFAAFKSTRATENHIGLDNPGIKAAAQHLSDYLPRSACFGISIAPDPAALDHHHRRYGISECIDTLQLQHVRMKWVTLNLSCPVFNHQYQAVYEQRDLIRAAADQLRGTGVPLWIKVAPDQGEDYYHQIVTFCSENGVRAIVATNTHHGEGGVALRLYAQHAYDTLSTYIKKRDLKLDVIACGGILTGDDLISYQEMGARAFQYHSAIYFRGLLAAALILREANGG